MPMHNKPSNFQERFTELCASVNCSDTVIARDLGVAKQTVSAWRTGVRAPKPPMISHIASVYDVSFRWLMGENVTRSGTQVETKAVEVPAFATMVEYRRVPMYESIACGDPIFADEAFSTPIAVDDTIVCDFALRCKGDSMVGARIFDGDIVFIRAMDSVDEGQIAVCLIDDDATLKRVYHLSDGRIELRAENPLYQPIIIGGEDETRSFRVLGKAVAFQSLLK